MASLKEIRTRITSIRSTRQITSAMKMVSASKLRKVQTNIVHLRRYATILKKITSEALEQIPVDQKSVFAKTRSSGDVLVVCLGSNKGLCGTYNALLIKHTIRELKKLEHQREAARLMVVGKKPALFFQKKGYDLVEADHDLMDKISYESACRFAQKLMDLFLKEHFNRIILVYNRYKNAVVHELTTEQMLPLPEDEVREAAEVDDLPEDDYAVILEPSPQEVGEVIIRRFICYNTYRIMLDASASEHGSRMTAMHKATDNADEMLKTLTLSYNKARQAAVTRELLDIVGGASNGRK